MKQVLLRQLIRIFAPARMFPTNLTPPEQLRGLIQRLHPLSPPTPFIRIGPRGDGGYLVPDDLDGIIACFSPGVGSVSAFERDCAERGMLVFMADASVEGPAMPHPAFQFSKLFIGALTTDHFITLEEWVNRSLPHQPEADLLLQMDIEGFEYEVLLATPPALLNRFRIIVAEFHHLDQLFNKWFFHTAARAIEKLLQTHACVHIHPNNCRSVVRAGNIAIPPTMEFTFLRRDRLRGERFRHDFPHPLDSDNTGRGTILLPACWYRAGSS